MIGHLALHQKIKNIRRDPRVALSFIGQNTSKEGMREYVVAYGRARITEGGAVPLLRRLAPIYLGPGGRLSAGLHAEHRGLRQPNHAGSFFGNRSMGREIG